MLLHTLRLPLMPPVLFTPLLRCRRLLLLHAYAHGFTLLLAASCLFFALYEATSAIRQFYVIMRALLRPCRESAGVRACSGARGGEDVACACDAAYSARVTQLRVRACAFEALRRLRAVAIMISVDAFIIDIFFNADIDYFLRRYRSLRQPRYRWLRGAMRMRHAHAAPRAKMPY